MSNESSEALYKTIDDRFTPMPAVRRLIGVCFWMSLAILYVVCCQVFWGIYRDSILRGPESVYLMAIFGIAFACSLVSFFAARKYERPRTTALALISALLNALGLAGSFILFSVMACSP
jgi:hypothetical protein